MIFLIIILTREYIYGPYILNKGHLRACVFIAQTNSQRCETANQIYTCVSPVLYVYGQG